MPTTAGGTDRILILTTNADVEGMAFNGRRTERGWPGGYAWEQSALLVLSNGTFEVNDVSLRNSAGDGIMILAGSTATLTNVTATDCFRGGVTIGGGGTPGATSVTIDNLQGSWLQLEQDDDGTGTYWPQDLTMTNSHTPEGIELEAWGSVTITNSDLGRRFWIEGRGGEPVRITDCEIGLSKSEADFGGAFTDLSQLEAFGCSIYYPRDIVFTRCTFRGRPGVGLELRPKALPEFSATGQLIVFDDCTFIGEGGGNAVFNFGDDPGSGRTNTVEFRNGCTYTGYDAGYVLRSGYSGTVVGSLTAA